MTTEKQTFLGLEVFKMDLPTPNLEKTKTFQGTSAEAKELLKELKKEYATTGIAKYRQVEADLKFMRGLKKEYRDAMKALDQKPE